MLYYLKSIAGLPLPPGAVAPDEEPESLHWLVIVERWGLPYAGGYLAQPYHFMQDIEAASLGRAEFVSIQAANRRLQAGQGEQDGQVQSSRLGMDEGGQSWGEPS